MSLTEFKMILNCFFNWEIIFGNKVIGINNSMNCYNKNYKEILKFGSY